MMASKSRVIYIGVTDDIRRRVEEHKTKVHPNSFTAKYTVTSLVWCDTTDNIYDALTYEKQLKGWLRAKKIALIEEENPQWEDLSKFF